MISAEQLNDYFISFMLLGGILFVGLFNITIYYGRKLLKAYLYFGLLCLVYFIWFLFGVMDIDVFFLSKLSDHHKSIIAVLSTNRMSLLFILYTMTILKINKPIFEKRIRLGANILLVLGLFMPISVAYAEAIMWLIKMYNMVAQLYLGYEVIKRVSGLKRDVRLINAIGYLIVCVTGVMEVTTIQFQHNTIIIAFIFMASQALILAFHYNNVLAEVENINATLEKKVEARTSELVRKEEEMIHLISSISHDLRTPISVVSGYMELLQSDSTIQPSHKKYMTKSLIRLMQMEKLTIDLFTLSQLRDKRYTVQLEQVNMQEIAQQIVELYIEQADQKEIKMLLEAEEPAWCKADKIRVLQVLDNLLINALAYASTYIKVSVIKLEEAAVKVTVSDDGSGIHPDDLPYVFDRFYKRRKKGSGIGLNNVKELVERMGGNVYVESKPEAGTSFTFTLPVE